MGDLMFMVTATAVSCLVVGVLGWLLLQALRTRSVTLSVVVCALVPVLAVVVAVQVNVRAMFLSDHDAEVIAIVLTTAAVLAVALAVVLGRRIAAGSKSIAARLGRLTEAYDGTADPSSRPVSAELADLTAQLDDVHRRLADSRRREEQLEGDRRDLVAALSHDLRTPLAGIRALTEGLEDGIVNDVPAALAQIRTSAERMARMTDDLFELSRVRAVPDSSRETPVSLREVAEDVVAELRSEAEARDVVIAAEIGDRLPVRGDGDELARALANLVSNAVRHTAPGGTVAVRGATGVDRVVLDVADGCGGIPAEALALVFQPGWRGAPSRTTGADQGSGLGLAIVHEVVSAHGGSVSVVNVAGGCRFTVVLPPA